MVKNQVQLITYPDSLGGNLKALNQVLKKHFSDLFTNGLHILPPFPSSGDRGFAPLTYFEIDPAFGTWEDITELSRTHTIILDLMVNHISEKSSYFQDFLEKGRHSAYADLFITLDKIWPDGNPSQDDLDKIFLRRDTPFSDFKIARTGKTERVWTTFGKTTPSDQIDIDVNSPVADEFLAKIMTNYKNNHVKIVRLDAVGYVIKKRGTSCFFVEPEIYTYLDKVQILTESLGMEILPEIHADIETQFRLADAGYWIYDFILPYLVLETLITKSSEKLKEYLRSRPDKQFTTLDCHDGVPLKPDMNGLYDSNIAQHVVDVCIERGANISPIFSEAHKDQDGFDVHQINGTYYSLLGSDDSTYLIARAIQFFTPGIPQIYYVGLLAGENDEEAVVRTGEGREINRHNYSIKEIEQEVERPVVKKLIELIKFRNTYPAFNGQFSIENSDNKIIILKWADNSLSTTLNIDLEKMTGLINYIDPLTQKTKEIIL